MSNAYDTVKAAVLARSNDPHMETCESCAAYVEQLVRVEMENRCDPVLNRLGATDD